MKILIIGNMGYVGPGVVKRLRNSWPEAELIGFDIGYFASCLTHVNFLPEVQLNKQLFGDVREFPAGILKGIDAVVYLAAISNDPMGALFEDVTLNINYKSCINIASLAKDSGVKSFVFASSCSIYGEGGDESRTEKDKLNPLTAYARSKVYAERDLEPLAGGNYTITCLRFATACGISNRLRLDLVLNDFVAGAVVLKEINILSDGKPWRPLINVLDMAKAIEWAIGRNTDSGVPFLAVNTGANHWNYQVRELAETVAGIIPDCSVTVNKNAAPDKRSYRVNFDLYQRLAPNHQPHYDLKTSIAELADALFAMNFSDPDFRESGLMRLKVLTGLQKSGHLSNDLKWTW